MRIVAVEVVMIAMLLDDEESKDIITPEQKYLYKHKKKKLLARRSIPGGFLRVDERVTRPITINPITITN